VADNDSGDKKRELQTTEETRPSLSNDFYLRLLDPPPCKSGGACDGCGRCEH